MSKVGVDSWSPEEIKAWSEWYHDLKERQRKRMSDTHDIQPISADVMAQYIEWNKNLDNNIRNTQFQGFAKALLDEIDQATDEFCKNNKDYQDADEYEEQTVTLVARRAYDLVKHAVTFVDQKMPSDLIGCADAANYIPDMTELPAED